MRLRIPWSMLGMADPSARTALGEGIPAEMVTIDGIDLRFDADGDTEELDVHLAGVELHDVPAAAEGRARRGRAGLPRPRPVTCRWLVCVGEHSGRSTRGHGHRRSGRRTTSSATSTAAGWPRPRSRATARAGDRSSSSPTPPRSRCARSSRTFADGRPRLASTTTPARSATSSPPSWTPATIDGARHPAGPADPRRGRRAARRPRPRGVPRRVRAGRRAGLFGSYVDTDAKDSDRYLVNLRPGRARAARRVLLPRRQVRRGPREVRRLPDRDVRASPTTPTPPAPRPPCSRSRPGSRPATGSAPRPATSRRPTTSTTVAELERAVPGVRLGRLRHATSAATSATLAEACVRQPSYLAHLSAALDEVPLEDWQPWLLIRRAARRRAVPHRRLRRGQLRLLRPHPQRHPRAARPLEARGRRSSRAPIGEAVGQRVRRAALPAARPRSRWTSWSPTCSRPTAARSPTSTG